MKAKLHVDSFKYNDKPTAQYVAITKSRITENVSEVTPQELEKELVAGKTVTCSYMGQGKGRCKDSNLVSQQVFMIDFDNCEKDKVTKEYVKYDSDMYFSFEDIKNHPFIKENASFMYHSFSHTEHINRFRVVFFTDRPLTTTEEVRAVYYHLHKVFPTADTKCKDPSRFFYGGRDGVEVNYNNVMKITDSILATEAPIVEKKPKTPQKANTRPTEAVKVAQTNEIVEFMINGEVSALRERFNNRFAKNVPSISVAVEYLRKVPIREVFNLPLEGAFCDLLHDEQNPSATIFTDYDGRERYYCHSASASFDGDLIALVQKITGQNFHIVVQMLLVVFNVRVEKSEEEKYIYDTLELLISALRDKKVLKENYEAIYREFTRDRGVVANVLSLIRDYTLYDYETGTVRSAIIMGQRKIAEMIGVSLPSINRVLKKMENVGMIETLDTDDIPKAIHRMIIRSKDVNNRYHLNVTAIPQHDDYISTVKDKCVHSQEAGGSNKGSLTRKAVVLTQGTEKAKELFKQDAEVIDHGILTKGDKYTYQKVVTIIQNMIKETGYAIEREVHKELRRMNNYKKSTWDLERIKGVRGAIIKELDLEVKKVNKEVKTKLGADIAYNTLIYVRKGF